ncbi:Conserved_hypothetical protein [Hexamita inflata]|uniref:Uncharacterized protein n=2 Tax=Hexamita inflata TaxID=28002 RepID=A0AA86N6Q0_9EUKA|nr:Conserved hypothetical protein [Hexamita inflata]
MENINIVPAKVQQIEQMSNTLYVQSSSDGKSIVQGIIPKQGSTSINFDKQLLTQGGGQTIQWDMQNIYDQTISTTNSGIKYRMKFALKFPLTDATHAAWGRYYMQDNNVYFQAATVTAYEPAKAFVQGVSTATPAVPCSITYGDPICISTGAMNSLFPIQDATIQYGGVKDTQLQVNRSSAFQQMILPSDYQSTMHDTWFSGTSYTFDEFVVPLNQAELDVQKCYVTTWNNTYKNSNIIETSTGVFHYIFYRDFFIPLCALHKLFNYSNNLYACALQQTNLQLFIKFQNFSIAKCLVKESLFDVALTGIGSIDLWVQQKTSAQVQNGVQSKDHIAINQKVWDFSPASNNLKVQQEQILPIGHKSVNALALCLTQEDTNEDDSTYLHQRFTGLASTQIINCLNKAYPRKQNDFIFFSDFNIYRGSKNYSLYTDQLDSINQIRQEFIRSTNASQVYDRGLAPAFTTNFGWLSKYAFILANLEMFSLDEPSHDVNGDGYDSLLNRIILKYNIQEYYGNNEKKPLPADDTGLVSQTNAGFSTIRTMIYQQYDLAMIIDIKKGKLTFTEN